MINKESSWENSFAWYDKIVGKDGHYYHQNLILPFLLEKIIKPKNKISILDLGCGQGILSRAIPQNYFYTGIDASPSLIAQAKKENHNSAHNFIVGDMTKPLNLSKQFDKAIFLLSLQNTPEQETAIKISANYLNEKGELIIIMNHPCFRIPRQSSWGIDINKKMQYRRVDNYMSDLQIPIQTNPSQQSKSNHLFSYHYPLSYYFNSFHKASLSVTELYELNSNKQSTGANAKMENRARKEIPLFLILIAQKKTF